MSNTGKLLLRISVSLICFGIVVYIVDFKKILALLTHINPQQFILALSLMLLGHLGSAMRFHYIVNRLGRKISKNSAIKASFVALWFNQLLPTGMGGDVVRAVMLAKQCGRARIILAALLDRVFGLLWMVLMIVIFVPFALRAKLGIGTVSVISSAGMLGLTLGLSPLWMKKNICHTFESGLIYKICHLFYILGKALRKVIWSRFAYWLLLYLALSFLPYAMYVALLGDAFGLRIDLLEYIALVPVVFIAMQFPISLGGWGVRELASLYVFSYMGMSDEVALIISVLYGFGLLVTSIPGNLFWVYKKI